MQYIHTFFATAPKNTEDLLKKELVCLGAEHAKETPGGVHFSAPLKTGYAACLHSRIANRILLILGSFPAASEEEVYEGGLRIPWEEHMKPGSTLAVAASAGGDAFRNESYLALKLKDAIADRFRGKTGIRPSVDTASPDLFFHLRIQNGIAVVSLDISGEALFKRGYRNTGGPAPLKENVAAAVLLRLGWPELSREGAPLADLFCGSGTFLLEGALMAAGIPPLFLRNKFGFSKWLGHKEDLWKSLRREAEEQRKTGQDKIPPLFGFDRDDRALSAAAGGLRNAGFLNRANLEAVSFEEAGRRIPKNLPAGLICSNPPYGKRLSGGQPMEDLYNSLGKVLLRDFPGWSAGIITGSRDLSLAIPIRAVKVNSLFNGPIECTLAQFKLDSEHEFRRIEKSAGYEAFYETEGARMFAHRLSKNKKNIGKRAQEASVSCYRLYDSDMPEYAFALDLYEDKWLVAQEYSPPKTIDPEKAEKRRKEVIAVLRKESGVKTENIHLKTRAQQKGKDQYRPADKQGKFEIINEGGYRFYVNFTRYLDTGIFLDHRITRSMIEAMAKGKRFLNLFSYTGTATVYAAGGGAVSTLSVDASQTYLDWTRRNLELNGLFEGKHALFRGDVLSWIKTEKGKYDLIFLDPPTFSNSKSRPDLFDVQKDHAPLLLRLGRVLAPGGIILFSTNYRKFRLNQEVLSEIYTPEDITAQTIPFDFSRNGKIHQLWKISHKK